MHLPWDAGGMHLNTIQEGWIGGTLLIGAAIGALLGGRLSDRFGRRHNIMLLAALFLAGALMVTLAPSLWFMYVSRFILGLAVGGTSATVPVYLAETAPRRIRGTIVAIDQLMIVTGQLAAFAFNAVINQVLGGPKLTVQADPLGCIEPGTYNWQDISSWIYLKEQVSASCTLNAQSDLIAWADSLTLTSGNGSGWRFMIVLCTIPAIALWLGMRLMPESPRWYAANQRYLEATGALKRVRDDRDEPRSKEFTEMVSATERDVHMEKDTWSEMIRTKWLRRLLAIGILIAVGNQLTGVNTVMYYAPKVLELAGMSTAVAITAQVLNGILSVAGSSLGLYLIYRFSRRGLLAWNVAGIAASLLLISILFGTLIEPHIEAGTLPDPIAAYGVLGCMGIFMLFVQSGNSVVCWTMMGEMFPARFRGLMNGTAVFCLWVSNAILTTTFPWLMANLGGMVTYAVFAGINALVLLGLYFFMPETSGKSLEEIEEEMKENYSQSWRYRTERTR